LCRSGAPRPTDGGQFLIEFGDALAEVRVFLDESSQLAFHAIEEVVDRVFVAVPRAQG
jgi:hypothetical protein